MNSKQINKKYYETYWNDNMIKYLNQSAGGRWFNHLLKLTLKHVNPVIIKSVADIGCGVGNKTAFLAEHFKGAQVDGFDFSEPGIATAKRNHKQKNVTFSTEDITKTKYQKKYDLITAFDVLEHIEDWQVLTNQLIQANTRYMLLSSPVGRMRPYEVHIGHVRNFKRNEIEDFMRAKNYKVVKTLYAGFPFHSPILRNLTNTFYKDYAILPQSKVSFLSRRMHDIWYVLFRYGSMKQRGDIFLGLFEKVNPNETN